MQASEMTISKVLEGQFKNGVFDGFGRLIDCEEGIQMGYWQNKEVEKGKFMSWPYGKWSNHTLDGQQIDPKGVYLGDAKNWKQCIRKAEFKDYK